MKRSTEITTLFLDIGGVLLTDGWDHHARERAATRFKLKLAEMEDRHHLTFDTYEEGKLTLEEYLSRVVFFQKRPFTRAQFRGFMFAQSKPYPEMIELVAQLTTPGQNFIYVHLNRVIKKYDLDMFYIAGPGQGGPAIVGNV
jgi:putative hydrolase of the HAD superfamily